MLRIILNAAISAFKLLRLAASHCLLPYRTIIKTLLVVGSPSNVTFWWYATGNILSGLLEHSSCSKQLRKDYLLFYLRKVVPRLGPSPEQLRLCAGHPSSYLSDDHTPVEFIWVIGGDGSSSIRFAMEPLSSLDGSPLKYRGCLETINSLKNLACMKSFDSTWSDICQETLVYSPKSYSKNFASQFFLGGDLTPSGMVAKGYYIPKLRAQLDNCSKEELVTQCIHRLGVEEGWAFVLSYINLIPLLSRPSIEMVAVDCLQPSQNRIKVYFRSHDNTLDVICKHMTLGGALENETIQNTLYILRKLWGFLFPGIQSHQPLPVQSEKQDWPGFLIYYEMTLQNPIPFPKVYIPVRQYCRSDAQIADAVSGFLKSMDIKIDGHYTEEIRRLFSHRQLETGTGIHTYIACCSRPSGPQISLYLSPEVFSSKDKII
ncbi:tryptophan dimethylallyltransferase-domain-containing protein [Crassisporium funariophilum]|nr:tryptophan dimethylallyltransferase-domain-containing protein [Crassisporium funariophilum]